MVRDAKERDWVKWGEQLQRNFLENTGKPFGRR